VLKFLETFGQFSLQLGKTRVKTFGHAETSDGTH